MGQIFSTRAEVPSRSEVLARIEAINEGQDLRKAKAIEEWKLEITNKLRNKFICMSRLEDVVTLHVCPITGYTTEDIDKKIDIKYWVQALLAEKGYCVDVTYEDSKFTIKIHWAAQTGESVAEK